MYWFGVTMNLYEKYIGIVSKLPIFFSVTIELAVKIVITH